MKILRILNHGAHSAMVCDGYCCDSMRLMRGIFLFDYTGSYVLRHEVSYDRATVRFCPFCGEKFDIEVK